MSKHQRKTNRPLGISKKQLRKQATVARLAAKKRPKDSGKENQPV